MLTSTPSELVEGVELHDRRGRNLYFKNVRVMELPQASVLTYNFVGKALELTEDRTIKHAFYAHWYVRDAILNSTNERLIQRFLEAPRDTYEYSLDLSDGEPNDLFMKVLEDRVGMRAGLNPSAYKLFQKKRGWILKPKEAGLDPTERQMLDRAERFCRELGLPVDAYPARITDSLEDNVLGMADSNDQCVWLTKRAFMMGTKQVAGTLMEELIHMHRKLSDESRPLQNYLVDLVVSQYEKRQGAPL
jgi:hypothetical protein